MGKRFHAHITVLWVDYWVSNKGAKRVRKSNIEIFGPSCTVTVSVNSFGVVLKVQVEKEGVREPLNIPPDWVVDEEIPFSEDSQQQICNSFNGASVVVIRT